MEERQQKSKKLVEQSQFIIRGVIDKQEKVDYSEKLENGGVVNYQIVPFHINQVYKGNVGNDTLVWLKLPINESHNGSVYYYDLIIGKGTECVIFCKPVEINLEEKNIKSIFELKERNRFSTITSFPNAPIWVGLYGQVFKSSEDLDSFFLLKKKGINYWRMPLDTLNPISIDTFYPQTISAGTEDSLTIIGSGFGNSGYVYFVDAKYYDPLFLCGEYDTTVYIKYWSPTKIVVELPGLTEPGPISGVSPCLPGSGHFRVERTSPSFFSKTSPDIINIEYSFLVKEHPTEARLKHGYLTNTHCDGITFTLHKDLEQLKEQIIPIFEEVFQDFSNFTGIDITLEKDFLGNIVFSDQWSNERNYIRRDSIHFATLSDTIASNIIMAADPVFLEGQGSVDIDKFFIKPNKILINHNYFGNRWNYSLSGGIDSNEIDFKAVFSHELCHALGLNHDINIVDLVIDSLSDFTFYKIDTFNLMNLTTPPSPISDSQRQNLFAASSQRARNGLQRMLELSQNVEISDQTEETYGIVHLLDNFEFDSEDIDFSLTALNMEISFLGGRAPYSFQIIDPIADTVVFNGSTTNNSTVLYYSSINIDNPGNYCVKVKDANDCHAKKCIEISTVGCDLSASLNIVYPCQTSDGYGEIALEIFGGTPPYNSLITGNGDTTVLYGPMVSASNLERGIYDILISDSLNCILSEEVFLIDIAPQVSGEITPICSNGDSLGEINILTTYGVPPLSFYWNTGDTTQSLTNIDSSGRYTVTVTDACGNSETQPFDVGIFFGTPLDNYIHHPTSCNSKDGDIDISFHGNHPEGGMPPYTYQWSTGEETANITGLGAGTYILTITDSEGCAETFTFNLVPEGSPMIALVGEIMKSCEGEDNGAIKITVYTEGIHDYSSLYPAYKILWYNSSGQLIYTDPNTNYDSEATGLPPGTYTVTVKDISGSPFSGCTSSATFIVEERPSLGPFMAPPQITPTCYGGHTGRIFLNASGGNPPYTYSWDNGQYTQSIHYLSSPSSYSVTVTDDCGRKIIHNGLFVPSFTEITNTIISEGGCPSMIELETSGGTSPYTYLWSNGQTASTATGLINGGSYQVTVSDANGCTMTQAFSVPIDEEDAFEILLSDVTAPFVPGSTNGYISVSSHPAGNYSYLWSNGSTGASVGGLGPGNYSVTATNAAGCSVARAIYLQSCYDIPGSAPNFTDFEIMATGGLFPDVADTETTVTASIREEGESFFTEDIPGYYSIRWEWGNGTVIGNASSLNLDLSSIPSNSQLFGSGFENLFLIISNGCTEKRINHYLILCGEEIFDNVASQFFILESSTVQPCRGIEDGTITFEIPNPNLEEVSVFRDGIELPLAGAGPLLLVEETGLAEGSYNYQVNIGGCTFNFLYSLKSQPGDLEFNGYDQHQKACIYNEFCNDQPIGIFQTSPFFDVDNATSFPCAVPVRCGLPPNDIFVDNESASTRKVRAAEYFRILEQLMTHPNSPYDPEYIRGILMEARARFEDCDKVRYCPASLDWVSDPFSNDLVDDVSMIDDGFCSHVTCHSFFWNFSFSVCDNDLDFPSGLLNTPLDFEGNPCMPITANLFELYLAWKNGAFEEFDQFDGSELEEQLVFLDGATPEIQNRARCATISYCNRDLNTVWNNTIDEVECGYFIITGEYNPRVFYDVGFNYEPIPMCQPIPHYDPVTEEITHETVHCRVGDGYRTKVILYDYSPPPPPQLNRGPVGITTKKFVIDTFYIEKLSNFALHIDEGQRAPKGILDTDYDKDLYFDFSDKAYIVHKSKLPNTAFHIDDWDKDQTLFCTITTEEQEYKISFFDSLPRWESSFRADGELKIEHFSKTGSEVVIGGYATGALEFNDGAIANLGNRTGFVARLSLTNGSLTAISTIENINPQEQLLFSENENEIIYFTGGYVDGAIGLNGNNINMFGDSGIFVIKFEIPGQFTLVADIENGTLFNVKKISQSQAEGEFTLALSSIGSNSMTIHNNGNQEQVQLEEEASLLILAFDENETLAWHKAYPTENLDLGHFGLANGENSDVFLGLTFSRALNDSLVSAGEKDIAILKLDGSGFTQWANAYGSVEDENVSQLMYDNGILFFGGEFSGSAGRIIGAYEFVNVTPYDSSRAYISLIDERIPPTSQDGPYENAGYSANSQYTKKGSNPIEVTAVFPNPFNNAVHVAINCERPEVVFVEMFNLLGKKILHYEEEVSQGRTALQVLPDHTLNNGIYHLKISSRSFPEGSLHKIVKMARY